MIANKLAILDETDTIKDGCCIPVLQDTETKRISYKNLRDDILDTGFDEVNAQLEVLNKDAVKIIRKTVSIPITDSKAYITNFVLGTIGVDFTKALICQVNTKTWSRFAFITGQNEDSIEVTSYLVDSAVESTITRINNGTLQADVTIVYKK